MTDHEAPDVGSGPGREGHGGVPVEPARGLRAQLLADHWHLGPNEALRVLDEHDLRQVADRAQADGYIFPAPDEVAGLSNYDVIKGVFTTRRRWFGR